MSAPATSRLRRAQTSGARVSSAARDPGKGIAAPRAGRAENPAATRQRPKLTGNRCQCTACGEYFNGLQPFDKHRVGEYAKAGQRNTRRCLAVAEMEARGWMRNAAGFWTTEATAQRAARHRADGFPAPRAPNPMQHHCPARALPEMGCASVTASERTP